MTKITHITAYGWAGTMDGKSGAQVTAQVNFEGISTVEQGKALLGAAAEMQAALQAIVNLQDYAGSLRDLPSSDMAAARAVLAKSKGEARTTTTADFTVGGGGTIYTLLPLTEAAKDWCNEHLPDDVQMLGNAYAVEHRYIGDIVEGIRNDGLVVT